MGGANGPHCDADERRAVAESHVRLSLRHPWRCDLRRCDRRAYPTFERVALLAVLAIAVAPLAFIATINPRFSAAPITAVIVLLVPLMTHASQVASAIDRVLEAALGEVTGFVVLN